jgi:hypothetical protein
MASKLKLSEQADLITQASLDSTRRIVRIAEDTLTVQVKINEELADQGEQLDGIERGLDSMEHSLKKSKSILRRMAGCCFFPQSVPKVPASEASEASKASKASKLELSEPQPQPQPVGKSIFITGDPREEEMAENLYTSGKIIRQIRDGSLEMSEQLAVQEETMERIHGKMQKNQNTVVNLTGLAKQI